MTYPTVPIHPEESLAIRATWPQYVGDSSHLVTLGMIEPKRAPLTMPWAAQERWQDILRLCNSKYWAETCPTPHFTVFRFTDGERHETRDCR